MPPSSWINYRLTTHQGLVEVLARDTRVHLSTTTKKEQWEKERKKGKVSDANNPGEKGKGASISLVDTRRAVLCSRACSRGCNPRLSYCCLPRCCYRCRSRKEIMEIRDHIRLDEMKLDVSFPLVPLTLLYEILPAMQRAYVQGPSITFRRMNSAQLSEHSEEFHDAARSIKWISESCVWRWV